jgi:hypothetical protein
LPAAHPARIRRLWQNAAGQAQAIPETGLFALGWRRGNLIAAQEATQLCGTAGGTQGDELVAGAPNWPAPVWGQCTRLYAKLTAHTLCIYINRLLGKLDFLQIKALAFRI